jgi:four helix bundle protein
MKDDGNADLVVRTTEFALRIVRMFVALPKTEEARVLGKQVLRSGTSVGANYREAQRARSKAEFTERSVTASRNSTKASTGSNF